MFHYYHYQISGFQKTHTLITDLEPNTEYSFRVNAFNRHGDGEFSASKKILTGGSRKFLSLEFYLNSFVSKYISSYFERKIPDLNFSSELYL